MAVQSFPFPAQHPNLDLRDVLYIPITGTNPQFLGHYFQRALSEQAKILKSQYFTIEEELARSFLFISPSDSNGIAYSIKFAEIIRAAANAYEIICRSVYEQIYVAPYDINIFNYLALDEKAGFSNLIARSLATLDDFPTYQEVKRPFISLTTWNKASPVQSTHVPGWWTAYNKIKHSNTGLKNHATLANAIAAVAAIFLLINKVYGPGVVSGPLIDAKGAFHTIPTSTLFFHPL